jgi:3-deoxy-manno-octulosonate cytidylyltransferase (CMP-KDO synthetase)
MKKDNQMKIIGIIPVRMDSSRFPGKPLVQINGIPMIGHIYFRSKMNENLDEVYIATCDLEIKEYANFIGAKCIMTKDTHQRASDRIAEALLKIEEDIKEEIDVIVLIQGDEPMLHPGVIDDAMMSIINDKEIDICNPAGEISNLDEYHDPNTVKVVIDQNDFALYYSREPIPSLKKGAKKVLMLKQIGIIGFRRNALINFSRLTPTPLEIAESIDMLRFLEYGYKIKVVISKHILYSVDTPDDLALVKEKMKDDELMQVYLNK